MSHAVLIAIGVDWDGRRQILAVDMATGKPFVVEGFLTGLRKRSPHGVEFAVADNHAGLRSPSARFSRRRPSRDATCTSSATPSPSSAHDCLQELRWLYDRRDVEEARRDLASWIVKWGQRYQKLVDWVEEAIEETFTFYRLPRQHHKHLKSTNMLKRLNEKIKRRTHVVRIFPMPGPVCASCEP